MKAIPIFFSVVLVGMLAVTTWASLHENIITALGRLLADPWAIASLFDAYFGFLTFYAWALVRERSTGVRVFLLVTILLLGNIAMALYGLVAWLQLPKGTGIETYLLGSERLQAWQQKGGLR